MKNFMDVASKPVQNLKNLISAPKNEDPLIQVLDDKSFDLKTQVLG
jgi:hypothetical protein